MTEFGLTSPTEDIDSLLRARSGIVSDSRGRRMYLWAKRVGDIAAAALLLVLLWPFFLVIAIAIKRDTPGPVFFGQQRMGYDRRTHHPRPFRCYKFRTMHHNCDQNVHEMHVRRCIQAARQQKNDLPPTKLSKLTDDGRITPVGRVLRKTSVDELPQLWNVLKGEMSLVGPRPVPLYEVAEYAPWHQQRLEATPGITGLWQVRGRGDCSIDEMANIDIEYISRQSLRLDCQILLQTIPAVIKGVGAE